jgi:hypothetical protein
MSEHNHQHQHEQHHEKLKVTVHYPAAKHPYEQEDAHRTETVGDLKKKVLDYFHLTEGQHDGKTFVYTLYHHKTPLEDLNETIGKIAGADDKLVLKLSQQVIQG